MPRSDGRQNTGIRPPAITQTLLSRADGSARFAFGSAIALASVTGPSEVRIREELVDRAKLEVNVIPLVGAPSPESKAQEGLLIALFTPILLLNLHPRSLIQLTIQSLSSPTSIPVLINAASLAFLDAGVEIRQVPLALSVAIDQEGEMLLDPDEVEEEKARSDHLFVFTGEGCVGVESKGSFTLDEMEAAQGLAQDGYRTLLAFVRKSIEIRYGVTNFAT